MYSNALLAVKAAGHCTAVEAGECEPATSYDVEDGIEWSLTDRPPVAEHPEKKARSLLAVQQQGGRQSSMKGCSEDLRRNLEVPGPKAVAPVVNWSGVGGWPRTWA